MCDSKVGCVDLSWLRGAKVGCVTAELAACLQSWLRDSRVGCVDVGWLRDSKAGCVTAKLAV